MCGLRAPLEHGPPPQPPPPQLAFLSLHSPRRAVRGTRSKLRVSGLRGGVGDLLNFSLIPSSIPSSVSAPQWRRRRAAPQARPRAPPSAPLCATPPPSVPPTPSAPRRRRRAVPQARSRAPPATAGHRHSRRRHSSPSSRFTSSGPSHKIQIEGKRAVRGGWGSCTHARTPRCSLQTHHRGRACACSSRVKYLRL